MIKVFGFLTKREGMQMQDFIEYYENNHVSVDPQFGAHSPRL